MTDPRISVLMPVRNANSTLVSAVESIRAQTLGEWELIAVNDGSTDGSAESLEELARQDDRIRTYHRPARGIVHALNYGASLCRAPLIARMDADDISLPKRLELQLLQAQKDPSIAVVSCLVDGFSERELAGGMRRYLTWLNGLTTPQAIAKAIYVESPIAHPSALMRRDIFESIGGYRDGEFPEDYDLWLRMHLDGARFCKVEETLLRWRDSAERLTRTDPRYDASAFRALKASALADGFLSGQNEVQIWGAGHDGKRWLKALESVGIRVIRYFDIDPKKIGRRIGNRAPVHHVDELPSFSTVPLLGAVGAQGARPLIRQHLTEMEFIEGCDYIFVQ